MQNMQTFLHLRKVEARRGIYFVSYLKFPSLEGLGVGPLASTPPADSYSTQTTRAPATAYLHAPGG